MSEVKVNKISPRSGTGVQLGDSGDTITIPAGATINNQGTATNFGATGSASWSTTVKTSTFTAVAGEGYFVNTTGGAVTVNLPAGVAGAVVAIKDYAGTFDTNAVTLVQNGSDKIGGSTNNKRLSTEGIAATLIFIDSTQGWLVTDDGLQSTLAGLTYSADFLVIAGGGGGGGDPSGHQGGGGGAGGYRNSYASETSGGGGSSETSLTLTVGTVYTVTIGAGGAGLNSPNNVSDNGVASSITGSDITDITTVGGGGGGIGQRGDPGKSGATGGSGGGGANGSSINSPGGSGGSGTSNQGFGGGSAHAYGNDPQLQSGGGGGAGAAGGNGTSSTAGGSGAGLNSAITGSTVARAGGGVGGTFNNTAGTVNLAGTAEGADAAANSGSGGGSDDGNGGSGVVVLRVPTANYSSTTTGSPTVTTSGSDKVIVFNGTGSYTG